MARLPPASNRAFRLRDLTAEDEGDIDLVAQRMRATLVEVEGEQAGAGLYSMEWLRSRVSWHLDPGQSRAKVVVAEDEADGIVGHSIFRIEVDEAGASSGLISTTYVVPGARRSGIAQALLDRAHDWFHACGIATASTWTSATNDPLIALYVRNGYAQVERGPNDLTATVMVRLERRWPVSMPRDEDGA